MDLLALTAFVLVVLAPFVVLLAKPLRRHENARVRYLGGVIAMLGLWLTFNASVGSVWASIIRERIEENMVPIFFAVVGLAQIPAAWISARVAFGESGAGAPWIGGVRRRTVPET